MSSSKRRTDVDVLRFIAVFLVLGRHFEHLPLNNKGLSWESLIIWRQVGWIGVDLFFVISGFLVSGLLFREHLRFGVIRPWYFLLRRGVRIYPPFYFMLIFSLPFAHDFWDKPNKIYKIISEFLFVQNYFYMTKIWNHTWSLAVEEHFYIMIAGIFLFFETSKRDAKIAFPKIALMISLFCFSLRMLIGLLAPLGAWFSVLSLSHYRMDSLMMGCIISYCWHYHNDDFKSLVHKYGAILYLVMLIGILSPFIYTLEQSRVMYTIGFTLLYLSFGILLSLCLAKHSIGKLLGESYMKPLAYIGKHSYSIYLWHMPINFYVSSYFTLNANTSYSEYILYVFIYVILSFIIGTLAGTIIENPVISLRNKLIPSRS